MEKYIINLEEYRKWKKEKDYRIGMCFDSNEINLKIEEEGKAIYYFFIDFERKCILPLPTSEKMRIKFEE